MSVAMRGEAWRFGRLRLFGWGIAAFLLLLPALAMQFTEGVDWTPSDFLFAGVLIGGAGLLLELVARRGPNAFHRAGAALAVANFFLLLWANAAVGAIGDGANPANLAYVAIILLALVLGWATAFRAAAMARLMAACAILFAMISAYGFTVDAKGAVFSLGFVGLALLSATLFRAASRR